MSAYSIAAWQAIWPNRASEPHCLPPLLLTSLLLTLLASCLLWLLSSFIRTDLCEHQEKMQDAVKSCQQKYTLHQVHAYFPLFLSFNNALVIFLNLAIQSKPPLFPFFQLYTSAHHGITNFRLTTSICYSACTDLMFSFGLQGSRRHLLWWYNLLVTLIISSVVCYTTFVTIMSTCNFNFCSFQKIALIN